MTWARLFIRSRRWVVNAAVALISGILIVVCGPLAYALNPQGGYLVALSAQIPLLAAITIQASLTSALPAQESHAARPLASWRFAHVILISAFAGIIIGIAATQLQPPPGVMLNAFVPLGPVALVRNLLALTGAALICSAITGPAFGWALPLAWAILPYLTLPSLSADRSGILTLLMQPDDALTPLIVAAASWAIGTVLATDDWNLTRLLRHAHVR